MEFNIIGCGGFTSEVLYELIANISKDYDFHFYDDFIKSYDFNNLTYEVLPVEKVINTLPSIITIANSTIRQKMKDRLSRLGVYNFPNVVSPRAYVLPNARLGEGNIIMPFCIISDSVCIKSFNIINSYTGVGHNSTLESFCTLGPRVNIGGNTKIGNYVEIGQGSLIKQGLTIGENSNIYMGSNIIRNVKENSTYGSEFSRKIL